MNSSSRLAHIDALRGLAALLVVWQHAAELFVTFPQVRAQGTLLADVAWGVDFGRIGVVCFFLISGFIIPSSLKPGAAGALEKFAVRRFFRLYPAYWLSVGLAVAGAALLWDKATPPGVLLANLTMVQAFLGQPHIQGLYWTLQIELVFYLLCALAHAAGLLHRRRALFAFVIGSFALFVLVHVGIKLQPSLGKVEKELLYTPYLLSVMFLGALMRSIHDTGEPLLRNRSLLIATAVCFGFPLAVMAAGAVGVKLVPEPNRFGLSHTLGLLAFLAGLRWLTRAPRFLLWLGTVSYSVYLLHPLVVSILRRWTVDHPDALPHLSVFIAATMLISIGLAALAYYLVEKPAIDLGHRYSRGVKASAVASAGVQKVR